MREFTLNLSARHDDYSDFGSTSNPRFGFNWSPIDALQIRANYAESFTAPALTSRGGINGVTAESSFGGLLGATASGVNANLAIPNTYPGAIGLPGCTAATPTCLINTATVPGIFLAGGNDEVDRSGRRDVFFRDRFHAGRHRRTADQHDLLESEIPRRDHRAASGVRDRGAGLNSLLQLYPGGVPPATIAEATAGLPQTVPLAATSYFIYSFRQRNAFNLDADGIDTEFALSEGYRISAQ